MAQCTAGAKRPRVTINTSFCPDRWLAQGGSEQVELIIHELAHALSDTPMEHGPKWGDACAAAGARVADAIARKQLLYDPGRPLARTRRSIAGPMNTRPQPAAG